MPKRVGLGLVGLDHWYTAFAVAAEAAKRRGVRLVAVADRSKDRLGEVAGKYGAGYATTAFRRVIEDPEVNLVCSQVNTRENVRVVRAALEAGKHVVCVKPMARTLRQADALIDLAEKRRRLLWSFDQLGRAGASARLKASIERGQIGQPISFHQTMWAGLPQPWPGKTGPSWWIDPKLSPFGAWADHAIYTIDMLRILFDAEVESVHGEIGNKRYPELGVEDYGCATLRFDNGMVAVLEHAWTAGTHYANWTKIVGTNGVIHMEPGAFDHAMVLATRKGVKPIKPAARRGGLLDPVLEALRAGKTRPSPARESRTNLAIAIAVYRSAKTGRYVSFD
jgi:predicted dehydrogenase